MTESNHIPVHVAIIMDGNGRWAQERGLPRIAGHKAGGNNIRPVVRVFADRGVRYLTLYAFSTENWNRPVAEVSGLLGLLGRRIDRETQALHEDDVRLLHIGREDRLSKKIGQKVKDAVELTRSNTGLTLCLAFDYGGRDEIVQAVRQIAKEGVAVDSIDEPLFERYLYSRVIPDPDLLIRTGGETRLSNFLLWQTAYSEFYFTPVLWPDFGSKEIEAALSEYSRRQRRFGGI